jgi:predicted MFS family arabinose efflux permease
VSRADHAGDSSDSDSVSESVSDSDSDEAPPAARVRPAVRLGAAGFVTTAVSFGPARSAYGLFLPDIRSGFGLSTSMLGLIAAIGYVGFLAGLVAAYFAERARGPLTPILLGSAAAAIGMATVAVTSDPAVLAVGVAVATSSAGLTWTPYNGLTQRTVAPGRRDRTLSAVSTGTAIGLLATGALALAVAVGGVDWRVAWMVFALLGGLSAAVNFALVPRGGRPNDTQRPIDDVRVAVDAAGSGRLLVIAAIAGIASSVWFSFAVDVVVGAGGVGSFDDAAIGPVMFVALGLAGLGGLATGDVIERRGLASALLVALFAITASLVVVGVAPTNVAAALGSAALQGLGIMMASAAMAADSLRVHHRNTVAGFTVVLAALAAGNIAGPTITGALGGWIGLDSTFVAIGVALAAVSWFAARGTTDP